MFAAVHSRFCLLFSSRLTLCGAHLNYFSNPCGQPCTLVIQTNSNKFSTSCISHRAAIRRCSFKLRGNSVPRDEVKLAVTANSRSECQYQCHYQCQCQCQCERQCQMPNAQCQMPNACQLPTQPLWRRPHGPAKMAPKKLAIVLNFPVNGQSFRSSFGSAWPTYWSKLMH